MFGVDNGRRTIDGFVFQWEIFMSIFLVVARDTSVFAWITVPQFYFSSLIECS